MPPSYTLYSPPGAFRAFAPLIAAEYNGIHVTVETNDVEVVIKANSPTGKAPLLLVSSESTPSPPNNGGAVIVSSHSIARYLAGLRRDTGLRGLSIQERMAVDDWMDWTAQDVELPACVLFYSAAGYIPANVKAIAKAEADMGNALKILEEHLWKGGEKKKYLVTDHSITLADIVLASTLLYPFQLVFDESFLRPYSNVVDWFETCVNQPEFQAVVGKVELKCQRESVLPSS